MKTRIYFSLFAMMLFCNVKVSAHTNVSEPVGDEIVYSSEKNDESEKSGKMQFLNVDSIEDVFISGTPSLNYLVESLKNDSTIILNVLNKEVKKVLKDFLESKSVDYSGLNIEYIPRSLESDIFYKLFDINIGNENLEKLKKGAIIVTRNIPLSKTLESVPVECDSANFLINGTVCPGLKDVSYMIHIEDEDGDISKKPARVCFINNGKFSYSAKLDKPTKIRIRAILNDGSICEAFIDEKYYPNREYYISVMDNCYDKKVRAWSFRKEGNK